MLITKYKGNIKAKKTKTLFPTISNQKLNAYLKEIADLCKIGYFGLTMPPVSVQMVPL
ncbi:hypothetical protein [Winogradskyella sp.]|uniref:hypothetical protein n=1 Tax=Winogradskyella sp. TaxID=1883156 RepID=UPI0025CFB5CF|nr:hypothetical protein [Winogradskyella sp.]